MKQHPQLTIAIAQMNAVVGDLTGNAMRIEAWARQAAEQGAELVVFPELALLGYPPEDLVLNRDFQQQAFAAASQLAARLADCKAAVLVGGITRSEDNDAILNSSFFLADGKVQQTITKRALPNYGVFDEKRVFAEGQGGGVIEWRGCRIGVLICEDAWHKKSPAALREQGIDLLIVQNASPYETNKEMLRSKIIAQAAAVAGSPVIYANLVGGQDELVFDGASFAVSSSGEELLRLPSFTTALELVIWEGGSLHAQPAPATIPEPLPATYQAMVLGLRDYVAKNQFPGVVIGLSGGIDSALSAVVAVDALGAKKVHALLMPSPYSSQHSVDDALALAEALGISHETIPIEPGMKAFAGMLAASFNHLPADTTEENIQARLRGMLLMAVSNKTGRMVLTTGNKSEMSVGYATLYGDMCGGFSVLKDVYKTTVFALARWRNELRSDLPVGLLAPLAAVIPESSITKPPSAELKPDQFDQDSLPPYELLDTILEQLIEQRAGVDTVVERGYAQPLVERVARMVRLAEYKRRQAPPGVKLTDMSFGRDRRYPITNSWRG